MLQNSPSIKIDSRVFLVPVVTLVLLLTCAGILTHVMEKGNFQRDASNKIILDDNQRPLFIVSSTQDGLSWDRILLAPLNVLASPRGLQIAGLILCILFIGASFNLLNASGTLPGLIALLVDHFQNREFLFLSITTLTFSLLGSTMGLMEEITPMVIFMVPLALQMGWDKRTGLGMSFAAACCGFAAATLNPFTLGVAQSQAGISPLFSGVGFRILIFVSASCFTILYLICHVRKLKKSAMTESSNDQDVILDEVLKKYPIQKKKSVIAVLLLGLSILLLIPNVVRLFPQRPILNDIVLPSFALTFLLMSLATSKLQGMKTSSAFKHYGMGLWTFFPAVPLILLATSITFIFESGGIKDTVVFHISKFIEDSSINSQWMSVGMFAFQSILNLFIPGGTSQALITIPILTAIDSGLSAQTVVLAYHLGDGFSNIIWPTNPLLMVSLGIAGVKYFHWIRFIFPLMLGYIVISIIFLLIAVQINYGSTP